MSVNFTNIRDGIGLQGLSGAPASPANGDIYYDTTLTSFRFYQAGAWVSLPVISGATITTPTAGSTFGNVTANGGMTGIRNTAIGILAGNSMTTGNNNVVMGYNAGTAIADGVQNVYIGSNAATSSTSGGDNVVIGNSANIGASTISSVIIGASAGASTTGNRLLVLGAGAGVSSGVQQSMAFGYTAVATADNQAVMGSLNAPVLDFVVGAGDTDSSTGAAVTIRTTNRTGTNTSATGANITIAGSRGTGTGTGGSLIFSTAPAGSSGPSLNALVTRLSISDAGAINIPGFTASRALVSDASKNLSSSSVTLTELGYVSGVTSAIQTQLNALASPVAVPSTVQTFASGSGTQNMPYAFIGTGISATAGATYTHNSVTYTVVTTVSSSGFIHLSGNAAPLASGTLTKASGTGDTTITFTSFKKPTAYRLVMVGGGGGGGPSGTSGSTAATAGGDSTFGSSFLTASGGSPGLFGGAAGAGGSTTINAGAIDMGSARGGYGGGSGWSTNTSATSSLPGGLGGVSGLGGHVGQSYAPGGAPAAGDTGAGGAGAGNGTSATQNFTGPGGGAGGCIRVLIPSPSATYAYSVGAGGTGGLTLANGFNGGAGGAGRIIIESIYS